MENRIRILKNTVHTAFKLNGFIIQSDSMELLASQLINIEAGEHNQWIDKIIDIIRDMKLQSNNVDINKILKAIEKINQTGLDDGEIEFNLINAYDIPKFTFDNTQKKFFLQNHKKGNFLAEADTKAQYMLNRYEMLYQKTIRHELFSPEVADGCSENSVKKFKLYFVENLLSQSQIEEVVVLGLLTQLKEGKYFIEDKTGVVRIDFSKAKFHSGLFCEGSFLLVEGKYQDEILKATSVGFPPPELALSSRAYFGSQNTWGGESKKLLKYSKNLAEIEKTNNEATIIFLSDVNLDTPLVMDKLKQLFIGFNDMPPVAIVLMGSFFKTEKTIIQKKQLFEALGELANSCDHLKNNTDLILIPSSEDPSAPNILPRPEIPKCLVKGLVQKWRRTRLATNPCRLQYCTQQILICRADLVTKLYRNTIHFPENGNTANDFARTIICQGTLCPLTPIVMPIYWDYDQTLQIYPLPDLIVIGDPSASFCTNQFGCQIVNVGSFIKSNFSFTAYVPSTKTIEDSVIPDEE